MLYVCVCVCVIEHNRMSQLKDFFSQVPLLVLEADLWLYASKTRENILWTSVSVKSSFLPKIPFSLCVHFCEMWH